MKHIAKPAAFLLALYMMFSFCACSSDKNQHGSSVSSTNFAESIIGTWEGVFNLNELMNEAIAQTDASLVEYLTITECAVTYTMTFDGSSVMLSVNEDSIAHASAKLLQEMQEGVKRFYEATFNSMGIDEDIDSYLKDTMDLSLTELVNQSVSKEIVDSMFDQILNSMQIAQSNSYTMNGDKLTFEHSIVEYTLEGDTLTIITIENATQEMNELFFPMVMTRK